MNYDEGIQFECQQTGQCCMSKGEPGYVYLTTYDCQRLANHFNISLYEFLRDFCEKTDGFTHLKGNSTCKYLKDTKCSVHEARPTQCRTWPFWPVHMNAKKWGELSKSCPGIGKGRLYSKSEIEENLKAARSVLIS